MGLISECESCVPVVRKSGALTSHDEVVAGYCPDWLAISQGWMTKRLEE